MTLAIILAAALAGFAVVYFNYEIRGYLHEHAPASTAVAAFVLIGIGMYLAAALLGHAGWTAGISATAGAAAGTIGLVTLGAAREIQGVRSLRKQKQ